MKSAVLASLNTKEDYLTILNAITGGQKDLGDTDKAKLLQIYQDNATGKFGYADDVLVKATLALDVPGANLLGVADWEAVKTLSGLLDGRTDQPEMAQAAAITALAGEVSAPLDLALARAALDVLAEQKDLTAYREDITALAAKLKKESDESFTAAGIFMIRVRERVR